MWLRFIVVVPVDCVTFDNRRDIPVSATAVPSRTAAATATGDREATGGLRGPVRDSDQFGLEQTHLT
jgi:hypothetical protein